MQTSHPISLKTRIINHAYGALWLLISPLTALYLLKRTRKQPEYKKHWAERWGLSVKLWPVSHENIRACWQNEQHGHHQTKCQPSQHNHQQQHDEPSHNATTEYPQPTRLLIHAVSLGETRAVQPLLKSWLAQYPNTEILITHMTPTGRETGQQLFADLLVSGQMRQRYLPYDMGWAMKRLLKRNRIDQIWLMETEIWPNLIQVATDLSIPVHLVNGRLSEKSFRQYSKFSFLIAPALQQFTSITAQSDQDRQHYIKLKAQPDRIVVTGNLKFDFNPNHSDIDLAGRLLQRLRGHQSLQQMPQIQQNQQALFTPTPIRIIALCSSREGEELEFLKAWQLSMPQTGDVHFLPMIVPRHPQRFAEVKKLAIDFGFKVIERSQHHFETRLTSLYQQSLASRADASDAPRVSRAPNLCPRCLILGDTLGEMFFYYQLSDAVCMGGGWQAYGGQNLLEPMSLQKPVWVGPHMFNFLNITTEALSHDAIIQKQQLSEAISEIMLGFQTPEGVALMAERGARAQHFVTAHQGSCLRTITAIQGSKVIAPT